MQIMWSIFEREAFASHLLYGVEIQSLVLMPNHFHMIATTPELGLGSVMRDSLTRISKSTNAIAGRTGHLFGGPYYWTLIDNSRYFGHVFKYVYRNPVRAGLCENVQDYPYSSLYGRLGMAHLDFPLTYTRAGMEQQLPSPDSVDSWLRWLNRPFATEAEALIRSALKRKKFELPLDRATRTKPVLLESLL